MKSCGWDGRVLEGKSLRTLGAMDSSLLGLRSMNRSVGGAGDTGPEGRTRDQVGRERVRLVAQKLNLTELYIKSSCYSI